MRPTCAGSGPKPRRPPSSRPTISHRLPSQSQRACPAVSDPHTTEYASIDSPFNRFPCCRRGGIRGVLQRLALPHAGHAGRPAVGHSKPVRSGPPAEMPAAVRAPRTPRGTRTAEHAGLRPHWQGPLRPATEDGLPRAPVWLVSSSTHVAARTPRVSIRASRRVSPTCGWLPRPSRGGALSSAFFSQVIRVLGHVGHGTAASPRPLGRTPRPGWCRGTDVPFLSCCQEPTGTVDVIARREPRDLRSSVPRVNKILTATGWDRDPRCARGRGCLLQPVGNVTASPPR